jgi:hypothetical protein
VSVPAPLAAAMLKCVEGLGLDSRLRSNSLVGLVNQDPNPSFASIKRTGVVFRNFVLTDAWKQLDHLAEVAAPAEQTLKRM